MTNWYDTDWSYRQSHVINSAANAGTNYQVKFKMLYDSSYKNIIKKLDFLATLPKPAGCTNVSMESAVYWDGTYLHVWFGTGSGGAANEDIYYTKASSPFTSWSTPAKVIENATYGLRDPTIWVENSKIYLFLQGYKTADSAFTDILLYKIDIGDDYTVSGNYDYVGIPVSRGSGGAFDAVWCASGVMKKIDSTYYLLYEAKAAQYQPAEI
jgi:hypothetical protein